MGGASSRSSTPTPRVVYETVYVDRYAGNNTNGSSADSKTSPHPEGNQWNEPKTQTESQMQKEPMDILQQLKSFHLISEECYNSALPLVFNYNSPGHSHDLYVFFTSLLKHLKTPNQEPDTVRVKVFTLVTGQTCGAHEEILEQVNIPRSKVELTTNPQDCDVIVVFCPIVSRVGSDVEAALKKIPESARTKPVILVLMHHTRKDNYPTDETNWSDEYPNVASDVHVLFHETQRGLLKCPKNNQAIQKLQELCNMYSEDDED